MGYYITITEYNLKYTNPNHSSPNPKEFSAGWYSEEEDVLPEEWYIKWPNDLINDLHRMIEQGIQGSLETRDEEGEYTLFKLTKDDVSEYYGRTRYPTAPDVVHKNIVKEVKEL